MKNVYTLPSLFLTKVLETEKLIITPSYIIQGFHGELLYSS